MLSIAYGTEQSDSTRLHYPEICYPAQGFQLVSTHKGIVDTLFGELRVKKLLAVKGDRSEPITYWSIVGNDVVLSSKEAKFTQLRYGVNGIIPDGLIFRVSSISSDFVSEYEIHQDFIRALMVELSPKNRIRIIGNND